MAGLMVEKADLKWFDKFFFKKFDLMIFFVYLCDITACCLQKYNLKLWLIIIRRSSQDRSFRVAIFHF